MESQSTNSAYTIGRDGFELNTALSEAATENIGKYGRIRKKYLQEYQPELYNQLLLSGKLHAHLLEINHTAHQWLEQMMPELAKQAGATKELKASAPMRWVGLMNCCKAQLEEIIYHNLIYV